MKRVVGPAGYTIVETLIFLAVSAVLFVSASVLITGRQRKTQFATTVRDFSSKLQSVHGNVASGYYNSTGTVKCTVSGGRISELTSDGATQQGTNSNCVYLGQAIISPQKGTSNFRIMSLVGLRTTGTPAREVGSLAEAKPRVYTETAETYTIAGADFVSLKADSVEVDSNGSTLAFIGSFGSYSLTSNALNSGSAHTDTFTVASSDASWGGGIEKVLGDTPPPAMNPKTISYCLTNGEQNALITMQGGTASYVIGGTALCS